MHVCSVFTACSDRSGSGAAVAAGVGRAAQGAGAAAAGVAGLALATACTPRALRDRALSALLGAVALGNFFVSIPYNRISLYLVYSISRLHCISATFYLY